MNADADRVAAQVLGAGPAVSAGAADDVALTDHPRADLQVLDLNTDISDHSDEFVTRRSTGASVSVQPTRPSCRCEDPSHRSRRG